jgi:hypothetical protein
LLFALGYFWLFAPKAVPGKYWALLLMLPLLFSMVTVIPYGARKISPIIIGKQQAILVRTKQYLSLQVKRPNNVYLSQWDYKSIAKQMGAFGWRQPLTIEARCATATAATAATTATIKL